MKFAQRNTDKSIETCGVLAGSLVSYVGEKDKLTSRTCIM